MRKLTRREIILLYILVCLVIVVFGWMILAMPALEKANTSKNEAIQAQSDLTSLKINQSSLQDLQDQSDNLILELNGLIQKYATSKANEEIDKQLTTLAQKYYLQPADLEISERKRVAIVSLDERAKLKEEKKELPTTKDGKPKGTQCDVVYVTMKVYGQQNSAAALAQEVSTYTTMRLNSMNVDNVENTITFKFAIYLIPTEDA